MIINNRRNFIKQKLEIKKSSIKINRKSLFEEVEYEISFEQLDNKKKVQVQTNSNLFFTGIFFFVFGLFFLAGSIIEMTAICTLIAIVLMMVAFVDKKRVVTIATYQGENINLYFTAKNKEKVIEFVDQIFDAANAFLLNKYGKIDRALPIEPQLDNLQFLRNKEIISEEEYETLKNQLLGRENKSYIGFSNSN